MKRSFERKDVAMNRRKFVRSLTLGAASLAAVATFGVSAASVGETVALPPVTLIDGTVLKPEHWKGKVLIVERFATWCPFCKVQNPKLEKLLKANRTKGLEVLALSIDKNAAEVPKYMQQHGYTFSAAMMTPEWQRVLGDIKGLPVIWIIGRDGKVKQIEAGELLDEDVAELARWL